MNVVKSAVLGLAVALAFATPSLAALKVGAKAPDFTAHAWLAGNP